MIETPAEQAFRLRTEGEGLSYAAIGRELGITTQRAHLLCMRAGAPKVTKRWERWEIVEAIREWELEHGQIPRDADWDDPARPYWCPSAGTVRNHYPSWNAAIIDAGFEPRPACPPAYVHELGLNLVDGGRGGTPPRPGPDHPLRREIDRSFRRRVAEADASSTLVRHRAA